MPITEVDLSGAMTVNTGHGNMGYTEEGRHKGHRHYYRFQKWPRLGFIDVHHTLDDEGWGRIWTADGVEVADLAAALAIVNTPPRITPEDERALKSIPRVFVDAQIVYDALAGEKHPGGAVHWNTPQGRAHRAVGRLHERGLIEYGTKVVRELTAAEIADHFEIFGRDPDKQVTTPTIRRVDGAPYTIEEQRTGG